MNNEQRCQNVSPVNLRRDQCLISEDLRDSSPFVDVVSGHVAALLMCSHVLILKGAEQHVITC